MDYTTSARRITRTLFAAQSLGSAATVAVFPVMAIAGAKLSGRAAWAGVPAMTYQLGQALAAFMWGYAMDRLGRRPSLVAGMMVGLGGAGLAGSGIIVRSFVLFLCGSALIGAAVSCLQLARFVAAEVHPPAHRARAISSVVLGGTVGAIAGPLLVGPMGRLAQQVSLDELSGPYGATMLLFAATAILIFIRLRPEPRVLARAIAAATPAVQGANDPARSLGELLRVRATQVAMASMVFGQLVMVMLMVITPLHMRGHEHPLSHISAVISAHVVGMYAFSIFSGRLTDRWGRGPVIMTGAVILTLAGLSARLSPDVMPLGAALFLLGLGWNFCYVAGSSLLADQLSPLERARTQGFNDLLIGLASAMGSFGSGVVFAAIGYGAMAAVGAVAALLPLSLTAWWQMRDRAVAVAR